jgi:hypothetical protein
MTTAADLTGYYYGTRNAYLDEFDIDERWEELMARADDDRIAQLVLHFVDTIVRADEGILHLGREIINRIDQTATRIATRQHVATLGELQRTPGRVRPGVLRPTDSDRKPPACRRRLSRVPHHLTPPPTDLSAPP